MVVIDFSPLISTILQEIDAIFYQLHPKKQFVFTILRMKMDSAIKFKDRAKIGETLEILQELLKAEKEQCSKCVVCCLDCI